jgi:N-acyl-phosphatidylethanolamine-hydrolysing phospholipase D
MARVVRLLLLATILGLALASSACLVGPSLSALASSPRSVPNKITAPVRKDARLAVLWVGHATMLLQMDDKIILTDPVFTSSVGQVSKRLVEPGIDPANLPKIDAVLISHMHFDHLSLGSLDLLEDKIRRLYLPRGGLVYLPPYAFPVRELSTWESASEGPSDALTITSVPVHHLGWRYGLDTWMDSEFTGYVVSYHGMNVYFGGDTAYDKALFERTAQRFPSIDLALLPIAPIEPREHQRARHVDPSEAVQMFLDLRARRMVPMHFDTFVNSTDEPGDAARALRAVMKTRGLGEDRVTILAVGEQVTVTKAAPR